MTITYTTPPVDATLGYVTGRWIRSHGSFVEDPDFVAESGEVWIIATTPIIYGDPDPADDGFVGVSPHLTVCTLNESGDLCDPHGNVGVWLVPGTYKVRAKFKNSRWPEFLFPVTTENTEENPVDLLEYSPITEIEGYQMVVSVETAEQAAASAAAALVSETNAAASETAAGLSETNAASSASAAAESETAAGLSETNAASSASAAAESETAAGLSETNAASAQGAAESARDAAIIKAGEASGSADAAALSAQAVEDNLGNMSTLFAAVTHKSSHAIGGDDPLTPADIGAASAEHTHTLSAITDAGDSAARDVGTTADTVAAGDHNHSGVYAPVLGADDNYVTDAEKLALHSHPAVIAQGATQADARAAIGAAPISGQFATHTLTAAASVTLSADFPAQSLAMTQDTTLVEPTISDGTAILLWLSGTFTPTWWAGIKWAGGTPATYDSGGTLYHLAKHGAVGWLASGQAYS